MLSFRARVERNAECLTSDQFGVANTLGRVCFHADYTVLRSKTVDRYTELRGCSLQESFASGCAGKGQVFLVKVCRMRLGAGRCSLIRSKRRVALNQIHAIKRHAKLFGDQLLLRGIQPLA